MNRRKCGRFELELPVLGIGCWAFGGGSYWGDQSQRDVDEVVSAAIDLGANFFDTAEGYNEGESEISLGKALKGRRHSAIIASKISPGNTDPDTLRAHCDATLKRLATDYLDIYMIHWPISDRSVTPRQGRLPSLRDALEALRRLKREGKIRYIGLSNFGVKQLGEVLDLGGEIVVDELAYNLLSRAIERDILPACEQNGIGVVGYSALMQGILSGKYQSMDEIPSNRTRTRHFRGDRPESRHGGPGAEAETWAALSAIRNIATDSGEPMERIALAWSVANPLITCTLAGARNRSQVEENVRGAEIELRPEVVKALSEAGRTLDETLGGNADYYQSDEGSRIW